MVTYVLHALLALGHPVLSSRFICWPRVHATVNFMYHFTSIKNTFKPYLLRILVSLSIYIQAKIILIAYLERNSCKFTGAANISC